MAKKKVLYFLIPFLLSFVGSCGSFSYSEYSYSSSPEPIKELSPRFEYDSKSASYKVVDCKWNKDDADWLGKTA